MDRIVSSWLLLLTAGAFGQDSGPPPIRNEAADSLDRTHSRNSPLSNSRASIARINGTLQYVVGMLEDPKATVNEMPGSKVVYMTAKNKKKFKCIVPDPNSKQPVSVTTQKPTQKELQQQIVDSVQKTLHRGCFTRQEGYWTYEVCPFSKVRQYHVEPEHAEEGSNRMVPETTTEFDLGTYSGKLDQFTTQQQYVQSYTDGQDSRQSQVVFQCGQQGPDDDQNHLLSSVEEPEVLRYRFTVLTKLLCRDTTDSNAAAAANMTPLQLLAGLENQCVYLNTGWWTYRFCFNREISQFHRENVPVDHQKAEGEQDSADDGQKPQQQQQKMVTTAEFSLGTFLGREAPEHHTFLVKSDTPEESYLSQHFTDGTLCDIVRTGTMVVEPRKTEVRLFCDPDEIHTIKAVEESSTCQSIVKVASKALCSHKAFLRPEPLLHEIACHAV